MKKPWKLLLYIVGGVAAIWLGVKFLIPIGFPFLLGLALAQLGEKPVSWLGKKSKFPRWLCSFFIISLIAAGLGVSLWLLGRVLFSELEAFAQRLPDLLPVLSNSLTELHARLLLLVDKLPDTLSSAASQWLGQLFEGSSVVMDTASQWFIGLVGRILSSLPDLMLFLLTMLLSAYLFSSQRSQLKQGLKRIIPKNWMERYIAIKKRLKTALGGYLKAQFYLAGITFVLLLAGLFLLGCPNTFLVSLLIALLDALPVFGAGVVLIPWAILSFLQGNSALAIGLLLLYAVCALVRSFLEPRFLGKQMGLHPLLTLLSLYAGFRLFSILGMIFVPIGVILVKQFYDLLESS